jgi:hypothetical protein
MVNYIREALKLKERDPALVIKLAEYQNTNFEALCQTYYCMNIINYIRKSFMKNAIRRPSSILTFQINKLVCFEKGFFQFSLIFAGKAMRR